MIIKYLEQRARHKQRHGEHPPQPFFWPEIPPPEAAGVSPHQLRFSRAARPPRRVVGAALRWGSSAITAERSSGVIFDQREISSIERAQPVQSRVAGCTTQMLMQGLSTSLRFQTLSDM